MTAIERLKLTGMVVILYWFKGDDDNDPRVKGPFKSEDDAAEWATKHPEFQPDYLVFCQLEMPESN